MLLRWVAFDKDFKPAELDFRFKQWIHEGITSYSLIATSTGLKSFQQLTETCNLEPQDFYRYLQLRHHFERNIKMNGNTEFDLIDIFVGAFKGNTQKKLVSRIYSCLQSAKNHSTLYCMWKPNGKYKLILLLQKRNGLVQVKYNPPPPALAFGENSHGRILFDFF